MSGAQVIKIGEQNACQYINRLTEFQFESNFKVVGIRDNSQNAF